MLNPNKSPKRCANISRIGKNKTMKPQQPLLQTQRLQMRAFTPSDAFALVGIANDRAIADTTISVPHPYTLDYAQTWITQCNQEWEEGQSAPFALELKDEKKVIGMNALRHIDREHAQAELACWVSKNWWGQGFATEAGEAMIRFGFETLNLNRIYAFYMARNPASGKVLTRIGLKQEGILRQRVRKWGIFEDVVALAILKEDWENNSQ